MCEIIDTSPIMTKILLFGIKELNYEPKKRVESSIMRHIGIIATSKMPFSNSMSTVSYFLKILWQELFFGAQTDRINRRNRVRSKSVSKGISAC